MGICRRSIKYEKDLKNHSCAITTDKLEMILFQANNCICDIKCAINGHGTGFFCKLPLEDSCNCVYVLITNNHVLENKDIELGKKIKFTKEKETKIYEIVIDSERVVYSDEKSDTTFIEIKDHDKIEYNSFLDIDETINIDDKNKFKNKDVYIIGNIDQYSSGKITDILEDNYTIIHLCATNPGMSGSPVINLSNYRVIGIYRGAHLEKDLNIGIFIREPVNQFLNFYKNKINSSKKISSKKNQKNPQK